MPASSLHGAYGTSFKIHFALMRLHVSDRCIEKREYNETKSGCLFHAALSGKCLFFFLSFF